MVSQVIRTLKQKPGPGRLLPDQRPDIKARHCHGEADQADGCVTSALGIQKEKLVCKNKCTERNTLKERGNRFGIKGNLGSQNKRWKE